MNRKPLRTGPRIRLTRPANRCRKFEETIQGIEDRNYLYTCQYCRMKFTHNSYFFRHMTTHHQTQQQEATFECNDCQIVFKKKINLDLHCQSIHKTKRKSKCESCAITFKSRYCLRRHLELKQLLAENSCVKCSKKFISGDHLAKHVSNKHTNKNITFVCDHCSLKFKAKRSLLTHLKRIHRL